MIPAAYFQTLQAIVIENPVVDAFTGGTLLVNILILLGIPGDARLETEVSFILYVDRAPIAARGTFGGVRAFLDTAAHFSVFVKSFSKKVKFFFQGERCYVEENVTKR